MKCKKCKTEMERTGTTLCFEDWECPKCGRKLRD
jgi:transposase-like protein